MGDVKKVMATIVSEDRLLATRLCLDVCENIHIHYRDMRLEFSIEEFYRLHDFLTSARKEISTAQNKGYAEGESHKLISQRSVLIPAKSKYGGGWIDAYDPDRIRIELQKDECIHIHYHDLRIEMTREKFLNFADMVVQSLGCMSVSLDSRYKRTKQYQHTTKNKEIAFDTVRLSDLLCGVFLMGAKAGAVDVAIPESPFYMSLVASSSDPERAKRMYDDYSSFVASKPNTQYQRSFEDYMVLLDDISEKGMKQDILVDGKTIRDGHHRACILWYIFGGDALVRVARLSRRMRTVT